MPAQSLRSRLILRGIAAHFAGLGAASLWVAVQLDGFPVLPTTIEGIILGAILAAPWAVTMFAVICFVPYWLEKHVLFVCIVGPMVVWASAYLLILTDIWLPEKYIEPVVVASLVAGPVFFALHRKDRRNRQA